MKFIFILFFSFALKANSQTSSTIINYQAWAGAAGCNIFSSATSVPATVNGTASTITHLSTVGQPTYDAVTNAIDLDASYQTGGTYSGTEYRIAYNFRVGYSYAAVINAVSVNSTGGFPNIRLKIINSTGTSTTCTGPQSIDNVLSGNLVYSNSVNNGNFADLNFPLGVVHSSNSYFSIANIPSINGGTLQTILIRKITIVEIPPSFTVSLIPPYTSCGSSNPITFTTNNPNGASGITNYSWNLGSASNNWLYNGSPAPQTISTGTTNTLSLTPVCGTIPSAVSGSVALNGITVNTTNSGSLSYNPFNSSINGTENLCSGSSDYFVNNLPCNANVTWSLSPNSGVVSASCLNCTQTTLTKQAVGTVTLTANVTNACGLTVAAMSKTISTDPNATVTGTYIIASDGYWVTYGQGTLDNSGQPITVYVNNTNTVQYGINLTNTGLTDVSWTISGACSNVSTSSTSFYCLIPAPGNGASGITATLHATGPCGTAISQPYSVAVRGYNNSFARVSPNPASNSLDVVLTDNSSKQKTVSATSMSSSAGITEIKIFDYLGNLKLVKKENNTKQTKLDVTSLKSGIYFIEVSEGNNKERQQVIIQK